MYANLRQLLSAQKIVIFSDGTKATWNAKKSLLVIVGDSIDKGPDSVDILDLWRQLGEQAPSEGGRVIHLLGNHEAEFLADPGNKKAEIFVAELQQKNIPIAQIINLLRPMPLALRVGKWLFSHSGLYPSMPWGAFKEQAESTLAGGMYTSPFLIGPSSILEAKDWWKTPESRNALETRLSANGFYGEVFGHQPGAFDVHGDIAGIDQLHLIKIDSGMAPKDNDENEDLGSQPGHLLLFAHATDLSGSAPPEAYSLSAVSMTRLPTQ